MWILSRAFGITTTAIVCLLLASCGSHAPAPQPDFTLAVSPSSQTLMAGSNMLR
jgi:hypothetical protein